MRALRESMSAFVVSKKHIDVLVHAGLRYGRQYTLRWRVGDDPAWTGDYEAHCAAIQTQTRELTHETANRVGAMLWHENMVSVDHRYQDHAPNDRAVYRHREACLEPVGVLKLIDCYEYQTCEHDGWEASEAHAFCQALRKAAIHALPG